MLPFRVGKPPHFNGEKALHHIERQLACGPRVPGTEGHQAAQIYLAGELRRSGAEVIEQKFQYVDPRSAWGTYEGTNLVARFHRGMAVRVLLAAHYDTRPTADQDPNPEKRTRPVPGANDGASGPAVLLELGRLLAQRAPKVGIDVVLFDLEDSGTTADPDGSDGEMPFAVGSEMFVRLNPGYRPLYGVVVDMVGDAGLQIRQEGYSLQYAPQVVEKVWESARSAGATCFLDEPGECIHDDHVPFLRRRIPVIDLIHYPFPPSWHTMADTLDRISAESLQQVGDVLIHLIYSRTAGKL